MSEGLDLMMLENQLSLGRVRVEFTKVSGEHRIMLCTKDPTIIGEDHMPRAHPLSADSVPPTPTQHIRVFDLEKMAWRSMRKANITAWQLEG